DYDCGTLTEPPSGAYLFAGKTSGPEIWDVDWQHRKLGVSTMSAEPREITAVAGFRKCHSALHPTRPTDLFPAAHRASLSAGCNPGRAGEFYVRPQEVAPMGVCRCRKHGGQGQAEIRKKTTDRLVLFSNFGFLSSFEFPAPRRALSLPHSRAGSRPPREQG